MPQKDRKVRSRSFSTTEVTDRQINELLPRLDCLSDSDVIRRAVSFMYEKTFPDYIYNRSAVDIEKRKKIEDNINIDSLTDTEYAERFIGGGLVAKNGSGEEFYLVHGFGNTIFPIGMKSIRTIMEEDPSLVKSHQDKVIQVSLISIITPYMIQYMQKNYDIDISGLLSDGEENKENKSN